MDELITSLDHVGIRVADQQRSIDFYRLLGFEPTLFVEFDPVVILENAAGVVINLIVNAQQSDVGNVLMDEKIKHPGYTHVAWRVSSMNATIDLLNAHQIIITQGPVQFGEDPGVSVFVRDPDGNVIELRSRNEDLTKIKGLNQYQP